MIGNLEMNDIDHEKNIQNLLQSRLLYVLFTIPQKIAFINFASFLGVEM